MKIIMYIGKTRALLGCKRGKEIEVLHERQYPDVKRNFYHAEDMDGPIHIERWTEILDLYLEGQNQDRILVETWLKSTPQILQNDQSIQAETPFGEPPLEGQGGDDGLPY